MASFISSTVRIDVHGNRVRVEATAFPPAIMVMPWLTMNADGELVGVTDRPRPTEPVLDREAVLAREARVSKSSVPTERAAARLIFADLVAHPAQPRLLVRGAPELLGLSWPTSRIASIAAAAGDAALRQLPLGGLRRLDRLADRREQAVAAAGSERVAAGRGRGRPGRGAGGSCCSSPTTRRTRASSSESEIGTGTLLRRAADREGGAERLVRLRDHVHRGHLRDAPPQRRPRRWRP